ncbi:MAG: putative ABC transporter permease [Clostridia bacterium]|nr:putative ABC transporter permease [Clostridia bacterium]
MESKLNRISQSLLILFSVSFLGWVMETTYCWILWKCFCDRGFLTLPFCTIYGFSVLAIYFLIGTPLSGGLLLRRCKNKVLRCPLYFLLAAAIPTATELVTGVFFDKALGIRLWNYASYPLNFHGYICLKFALIWGALITLFMGLLFPLMQKGLQKIPPAVANTIAFCLLFAVCVDWIVCLLRL